MISIVNFFWQLYKIIRGYYYYFMTKIKFDFNGVIYSKFVVYGIPILRKSKSATLKIGNNFTFNNDFAGNIIGRQQPCIFMVSENAKLTIGNNVGISSSAIICTKSISIGNNVIIGGNTCIYDTDFHPITSTDRLNATEESALTKRNDINIEDNVFIGAHTTILKGVRIGENSVIGACSVITKNISPNEMWAGNPARFIRKL